MDCENYGEDLTTTGLCRSWMMRPRGGLKTSSRRQLQNGPLHIVESTRNSRHDIARRPTERSQHAILNSEAHRDGWSDRIVLVPCPKPTLQETASILAIGSLYGSCRPYHIPLMYTHDFIEAHQSFNFRSHRHTPKAQPLMCCRPRFNGISTVLTAWEKPQLLSYFCRHNRYR